MAQCVSRTPPHHSLPAFLNFNSRYFKWSYFKLSSTNQIETTQSPESGGTTVKPSTTTAQRPETRPDTTTDQPLTTGLFDNFEIFILFIEQVFIINIAPPYPEATTPIVTTGIVTTGIVTTGIVTTPTATTPILTTAEVTTYTTGWHPGKIRTRRLFELNKVLQRNKNIFKMLLAQLFPNVR